MYTGSRNNDYKKVSINYQSWFYPLEGKEAKYFLPLPNKERSEERRVGKESVGLLRKINRKVIT